MKELMQLIHVNDEKLNDMLNKEQRRRMDAYVSCLHEYYSFFSSKLFVAVFVWVCVFQSKLGHTNNIKETDHREISTAIDHFTFSHLCAMLQK